MQLVGQERRDGVRHHASLQQILNKEEVALRRDAIGGERGGGGNDVGNAIIHARMMRERIVVAIGAHVVFNHSFNGIGRWWVRWTL